MIRGGNSAPLSSLQFRAVAQQFTFQARSREETMDVRDAGLGTSRAGMLLQSGRLSIFRRRCSPRYPLCSHELQKSRIPPAAFYIPTWGCV